MTSIPLRARSLCSFILALSLLGVLPSCADVGASGAAPAEPSAPTSAHVPPALRASYLAARQRGGGAAYGFARTPSGGAAARNGAHQLAVALADGALDVTSTGGHAWHLLLRWTGLGRGAALAPAARLDGEAGADGRRASYRRADGSEERYDNGPLGVEQTFVLAAPPAGRADQALAIEVSVEGDLTPVLAEGGAAVDLRDARGAAVARYTDLAAFDADGVERRAWIEVSGGALRLRVDDDGARYPLRIDPLVATQQAELTASDSGQTNLFGGSVFVNGTTAIIGSSSHGTEIGMGASYVFVQDGATWTQQAELTASDETADDGFGGGVVSGDIALVSSQEAVYVFARSGTTWTQQAKLDGFYAGVVSGTTAIVGGHSGTYAYVQSGTTWTQQATLTPSDEQAGDSPGPAALEGTTAILTAPSHTVGQNVGAGAVYVFEQSGAAWTQQAEITASDAAANDVFGFEVALSGDTLLVSAPGHRGPGADGPGTAYVFVRSGATWTQQAELNASDQTLIEQFGSSVALSGDTAIIGAVAAVVGGNSEAGAAYVFVRSGTSWTQQATLVAGDGAEADYFGWAVSVSGGVAFVGAPQHTVGASAQAGAAYVFDFCSIGGTTYVSGVANPANACQVCAVSTSATAWSDQSNGATCPGGTCQTGACVSDGGVDTGDAGTTGSGGTGTTGSGTGTNGNGGSGNGNAGTGAGYGLGNNPGNSSGCNVASSGGAPASPASLAWLLLGAALIVSRRRPGFSSTSRAECRTAVAQESQS